MAFQKTAGSSNSMGDVEWGPKYATCEKGQVLVTGHLIKIGQDQFGKPSYFFRQEDGKTLCLNHSKKLEEALHGIAIGNLVRVTYDGVFTITKGPYKGTNMHLFVAEVDMENSVPGSVPTTVSAPVEVVQPLQSVDNSGPAMDDSVTTESATMTAAPTKNALLEKFKARKG